jgi:hypothetical protein
MLGVTVPASTDWDEATEKFITFQGEELLLEHSLASVSKWESLTSKPFLVKEEKSGDEILEYIKCMTISPVVDPNVYAHLSNQNISDVNEYINLKMTATWFRDEGPNRPNGETITAEIMYYWIIALNIPMECQYWHLQKFLTLVRVVNLKNAPPKKQTRGDMAAQRRALNEQRLAQNKTTG